MRIAENRLGKLFLIAACSFAAVMSAVAPARAQRVLGIDISAHQGNLSTTDWATLHRPTDQQVGGVFGDGRDFVMIRSSRGGTTGFDREDGILTSPASCNGSSPTGECLSHRYDDPYFGQNITRATLAGMFAAAYHRSQANVIASTANSGGIANTGTDEANHFMQMASAWMRPGYLPPMFDFEDGIAEHPDPGGDVVMAQFALDFSNRIYEVMKIRPSMYTNGNYAQNVMAGGTAAQRSALAQQPTTVPTVVSPAYPTLVNARYPNGSGNLYTFDIQTDNPTHGFADIYGPWDDYGNSSPWAFWQYSSGEHLHGYSNGVNNIDADVANGDIEFVKDQLIPAVWWSDSSGDWSTLANWNSGQPNNTYDITKTFDAQPLHGPYIPPVFPNTTPVQGSKTLPAARLPGQDDPGTGIDGQNDTVILEHPTQNITVTLSTGSHDIRKLYMREALNITGGSLTVNYDPNYNFNIGNAFAPRSGPISAQFSGPVSMSAGSLNVHTLLVDPNQAFTLSGGTVTLNTINLRSDNVNPAKIALNGNVILNVLNNGNPRNSLTATIANVAGGSNSGYIDLGGGTRTVTLNDGPNDVDLSIAVPIVNGGLTKAGAGTLKLDGANTFSGPVTVSAGTLRSGHASGLSDQSTVTVNNSARWEMNGVSDSVAALVSAADQTTGVVQQGAAALTLAATSGSNTYFGTISGGGTFTKNGGATQTLAGNNTLGAVNVNAGSLLFNGLNTTGAVIVNGGSLGGTGSVSGAVTINNGGHLAPGASIESLGVGALTLNAGSILDFELGSVSFGVNDRVDVADALTINGGSINFTNASGFGPGLYTIFNYGSISGDVTILSLSGPSNLSYELYDQVGSVALVVGIPGDFNDDGDVNSADYVIWQKLRGTAANLPNDNNLGGTIGAAHYDMWVKNYGRSNSHLGSGGGNVPEPAAILLAMLGIVSFAARRQQ